jgi:hypothetical protein
MNYELCKELKEAGFPQEEEYGHYEFENGNIPSYTGPGIVYFPTLSELIEACGIYFDALTREGNGTNDWFAFDHLGASTRGKTPEEAVARLWLSLNS